MKGSVKMEGIDAFLSPIFALKNAANGAFGTFPEALGERDHTR
jgi:hypothetical protein